MCLRARSRIALMSERNVLGAPLPEAARSSISRAEVTMCVFSSRIDLKVLACRMGEERVRACRLMGQIPVGGCPRNAAEAPARRRAGSGAVLHAAGPPAAAWSAVARAQCAHRTDGGIFNVTRRRD